MNRKLLVTLLQKNIQELELITQGFMEMTDYPMPIIILAQRKTEDIQLYIKELSELINETITENISSINAIDGKLITAENNTFEVTTISTPIEEKIVEENNLPVSLTETELSLETNTFSAINDDVQNGIEVKNNEIIEVENNQISEIAKTELLIETISNQYIEEEDDDDDIVEEDEDEENEVEDEEEDDEEIEDEDKKIIEEIEISPPATIVLEENRKTILGERAITGVHTRNELLSKIDNSISSTLANKKITDIKQAISIGDRFRFQRELFRANGEDMNKTLTYINQLATLEEVLSFLKSKYGWAINNEAAEDFYQIVRRRFI